MTKVLSQKSIFDHLFNEWNEKHGTHYKNEKEVMRAEGLAGFNEMKKYINNKLLNK